MATMLDTTLYFYKGTPFGGWEKQLDCDMAMLSAKAQLELGVRMSMTLKEQAAAYLRQLDLMEASMCRHAKMGDVTRKVLVKVAKDMDMSIDKMYAIWCVNICCLLIMKKLENDDMNGIMRMKLQKTR